MATPKPQQRVPTDRKGTSLEWGYFSVSGELFEAWVPRPAELLYMLQTDSQVQAFEKAIRLPLERAPMRLKKPDGDTGQTELCRKILFDPPEAGGMKTPWGKLQQQLISAVFLKRAPFELVWRYDEKTKKAVYDSIEYRPVVNCTTLVKNNEYIGFKQRSTSTEGSPINEDFLVAKNKAFVYFHADALCPAVGSSILQTAWGDYQEKLKINRMWNIHLQNGALGTWIGKIKNTVEGAATKLFDKLRKFRGGGGWMVLGSNEDVSFDHTRGGAGSEFETKIRYHDQQMMGSGMLRWQLLGTGSKSGSWALSRDHSDFFLMLEEALLADIAEQTRYGLLAPLVAQNFGVDAPVPIPEFDPLEESMLDASREAYLTLATSAYRPIGPLWSALEQRFGQSVGISADVMDKQQKQDEQSGGLPPSLDPNQTPRGLIRNVEHLINKPNAPNAPTGQPPVAPDQGAGAAPAPTPNGAANGNSSNGNGVIQLPKP